MIETDYFKLFDLPVSFKIDPELLKKKFYKLSRLYHPDHFTMESSEKQEEVLEISGILNMGYKILGDENLRMKYILDKFNLLKGTENQPLPQSFLMQMMEINEQIFDLQMNPNPSLLQNVISEINHLDAQMKNEADQYIDDFENQRDITNALENIKDYFLKSKYLLRIRENISTFALS
jgi:molecular chaperone HscB